MFRRSPLDSILKITPALRFALICLLGSVLVCGSVWIAQIEPGYNYSFQAGAVIESSKGRIELTELDVMPEPGEIQKYEDFNRFFTRQDQIFDLAQGQNLTVAENTADPGQKIHLIPNDRKVGDLPTLFWIQVAVALGGILISGWIWSLKPKNLATSFFFLSGLSMGASALTSAIYTSRILALPSKLFFPLEVINAWGASAFGMFIIALFLIYPRSLKGWKWMMITEFVIFFIWTAAYSFQLAPENAGISHIIVVMMTLILIAIGAQFFITQKDPKSRAILLWLGISVILGAGIFVALNTVPIVLGIPPFNQGYTFLSFLIIYLGLAAGLRQFRLFEVGQWAFRFLFYILGAFLFIALDALLIYVTGINRFPALTLALILVGFLYLPLRDFIWRFLTKRKELKPHELLTQALDIAFTPSVIQRNTKWKELWIKLFDPLEVEVITDQVKEVYLENDGLTLILPAVAEISALKIIYPGSGRLLFNPQSLEMAQQIVTFIEQAESSREAYDRGVIEERMRIAQDLHDDVGARLLSGLHTDMDKADLRSIIHSTMMDMRSIIKGIAGEEMMLSDLLADLRADSQQRLAAVGITLLWPTESKDQWAVKINYRLHKAISSILREVVSNVIKHAKARKLSVEVKILSEKIQILFQDDGVGFPPDVLKGEYGFGLKGLHKRIHDLSGNSQLNNNNQGSSLQILIPLK